MGRQGVKVSREQKNHKGVERDTVDPQNGFSTIIIFFWDKREAQCRLKFTK